MTLQEAIRSGKKFTRESIGTGEYFTYEDFMEHFGIEKEDVLATDYITEPVSTITITLDAFAEVWNEARGSTLAIKPAGQSDFYKRLETKLKSFVR